MDIDFDKVKSLEVVVETMLFPLPYDKINLNISIKTLQTLIQFFFLVIYSISKWSSFLSNSSFSPDLFVQVALQLPCLPFDLKKS